MFNRLFVYVASFFVEGGDEIRKENKRLKKELGELYGKNHEETIERLENRIEDLVDEKEELLRSEIDRLSIENNRLIEINTLLTAENPQLTERVKNRIEYKEENK